MSPTLGAVSGHEGSEPTDPPALLPASFCPLPDPAVLCPAPAAELPEPPKFPVPPELPLPPEGPVPAAPTLPDESAALPQPLATNNTTSKPTVPALRLPIALEIIPSV